MCDSPENDPSAPPGEADLSAGEIIAAALAPLQNLNPAAHALLVSQCGEGFFAQPAEKRALNKLADRLLATIPVAERPDAH